MSLFVVAIGASPGLGPEYLPAKCVVCGRALQTSPQVRREAESKGAEIACVICALTGAERRGEPLASVLCDGGSW